MNSNFSQAITQIIVKGKSALYLVLKKKPLPIEILEALAAEVEIRYEKFLNQKLPLLKNIKPDNPEQFYECFLIRAMIEVLKQMLKEKKINLSEKDLNTFELIFKEDLQKKKEKIKKAKIKIPEDNSKVDDENNENNRDEGMEENIKINDDNKIKPK